MQGLAEDKVCVGDRYRLGAALFEVTQPPVTCYRVGIRMDNTGMAALLVSHRRPGFYLRVLAEGEVGAVEEIAKVADGPERITVAEIDALLYLPGHRREQLERALRIPALSPGWKGSFQALVDQSGPVSGNPGLAVSTGPAAWPGFRSLRVAKMDRESASVISLSFEQPDHTTLRVGGARIHTEVFGPEDPITPGIAALRGPECALIGGTVRYQPAPLEPAAEGSVLTCCSQPEGDLEIDL